jgi:hypothetical protein
LCGKAGRLPRASVDLPIYAPDQPTVSANLHRCWRFAFLTPLLLLQSLGSACRRAPKDAEDSPIALASKSSVDPMSIASYQTWKRFCGGRDTGTYALEKQLGCVAVCEPGLARVVWPDGGSCRDNQRSEIVRFKHEKELNVPFVDSPPDAFGSHEHQVLVAPNDAAKPGAVQ